MVYHRAPQVINLLSASHTAVTQKDQLTLRQWGLRHPTVMPLLALVCCTLLSLLDTCISRFKPNLMFLDPILHFTGPRLLYSPKQKIHRELGVTSKHQEERSLSGSLMGGGIIAVD